MLTDRTPSYPTISPSEADPLPAVGKGGPGRSISNTIVVVDDEEAICAAAHPRLVILDLSMPWMDGKAMLAALKSNPVLADIPVIVSTADPSPALNGIPVMKKPIDFDLLLETIRANC